MATKSKQPAPVNRTLANRETIMAEFTALVMSVPEAPEGDVADIIGPILGAASLDDFQRPAKLPSSKELVGIPLRLETVERCLSDKPTRTGYYLMCQGARLDTGEVLRWTAGGEQTLAVQARLHSLHMLPAYITYVAASTRSGNDAINCQVNGTGQSETIDA